MSKLNVCVFFDKIDKLYQSDSISVHRSLRAICRGYLDVFDKNRRMNPQEFALCKIGMFDDETGELIPCNPPEVIDPTIVFAQPKAEQGEVVDE